MAFPKLSPIPAGLVHQLSTVEVQSPDQNAGSSNLDAVCAGNVAVSALAAAGPGPGPELSPSIA
eukprot:1924498-Rhodomonas_salina.2